MDSKKLAYFVEVIDQGSINRAAACIGISQPSISKNIRLLEEELGVKLVERSLKGVRPTDFGTALYLHARAIVEEFRQAREAVQSLKDNVEQQVVIGAIPTLASPIVAPVLGRLLSRKEQTSLFRIVERPELELLAELRRGAFDFALGILQGSLLSKGLIEQSLFTEHRRIITRRGHPLTKLGSLQPTDLLKYPWIAPPAGAVNRKRFEDMFRRAGLDPPKFSLPTGVSLPFVKALLSEGDYLVLLPVHCIAKEVKLGEFVILPFNLRLAERKIGIIRREHHPIPRSADAFLRELKIVARSAGASPETN